MPILEYFLNYCRLCCVKVSLKLFDIKYFYDSSVILHWNHLYNYVNNESYKNVVQKWLMDLKNRFQLSNDKDLIKCFYWIDDNISLNSLDDNTIILKKNENTLILKLDKTKKKVDVIFNKKNILQFDIVENDGDYIVNRFDIRKRYNGLLQLQLKEYRIFSQFDLEETMVLPFISRGKFRDTDREYWKKIEQDVINLINDEKFYKMILKTINDFERSSINILKCKA